MNDVDEYYRVDQLVKTFSKRRKELKEKLEKRLMRELKPDPDTGHLYAKDDLYEVTLQIKRSTPEPDEGALQQLLTDKGLLEECLMEVVDRNKVKQLWIEGKLLDDDLRSILPHKDPKTALKVEPCTKE